MALFEDKSKIYVPRLMQDLSITREQACGIMGNIGGETGGFTALQEKKPTVKGSRGGYGWMQWTGPRRKKYEAWAAQNNLNPATDEANYRYLVQETMTDELHSLIQLRKTSTVEAATETFMLQNLRPGVPNLKGRVTWANRADDATKVLKQEQKETRSADWHDSNYGWYRCSSSLLLPRALASHCFRNGSDWWNGVANDPQPS
jgi:hypothetical protein